MEREGKLYMNTRLISDYTCIFVLYMTRPAMMGLLLHLCNVSAMVRNYCEWLGRGGGSKLVKRGTPEGKIVRNVSEKQNGVVS